jgi:hypothetical protein
MKKFKPTTIRDMARRRGLSVHKARYGGWYVTLIGLDWANILYCTHQWQKVASFVRSRPILIKR